MRLQTLSRVLESAYFCYEVANIKSCVRECVFLL